MDFMEQCDDCLCKECLENCNENPDGCCYTCCKDSDECEPISQCPFGWYHDNQDFMVNVCKRDENVKLIAQSMKLPNGGNAQLDVGNNQEYILPFIGELRSLLNDNQAELEKVPDFREALEQFMFEMEEMSDYPWIELLWENEIKTRSNRVKFVFNYMNKSYCLIQYYYSNVLIGMERMNYVIEYIVNHRNDDTTQNE